MATPIPRSFIDDLLTRVDIVEVIEIYVTLQKAGRDYKACCPFHHEKTPSFTVSPHKQFYYCFGCGAHGNAIKFLMEHQHLSFVESIEQLATRVGLTVPVSSQTFSNKPQENRADLYQLMQQVTKFYGHQLKNHPQKNIPIDYLRTRGLTGEICKHFGVGFAPPGRDNLLKQFPAQQEPLLATGMLSEKTAQQYQDRFRNRIMFPIRDRQGRVIAFGGRVLDDATPKYLNSPETAIFHKSQELYGLYEVLQSGTKLEKLVVVEGYLDVIALAQFGIQYSVATLGTALNVQHLRRLFRLVNKVIFCFDGDAAGLRAAWRSLELCLPLASDELDIRFLFLPGNEDPDSFVRSRGKESFEEAIDNSTTLTTFLLERLLQQVDLSHLDGKAKLVKLAEPLLQQLPDGARKTLIWDQLAVTTHLSVKDIKRLSAGKHREVAPQTSSPVIKITLGTSLTSIQRLLSLLLQYPYLIEYISPSFTVETPGSDTELLSELFSYIRENPDIHTGLLLEDWGKAEQKSYLAALAAWDHLLNETQLQNEIDGLLLRLKKMDSETQLQRLQQKIIQQGMKALTSEEKSWLQSLTNRHSDLESINSLK